MIDIHCSDAAKKHFSRVLEPLPASAGVLLSLKKAGCAGYMYVTDAVSEQPSHTVKVTLDTLVFYVEKTVQSHLHGLRIDLVQNGPLESKLHFENPNTLEACGCGDSVLLKDM